MITFWIFAIAMVILALIFLLRPLFLDMKKDEIERSELNVNITKERIAELKVELEQGTISQSEYEQTLEELEQALLFDVEQETTNVKKVNSDAYNRFSRIALILSVPIFAISMYSFLGKPELIGGVQKQTAAAGHNAANKLASIEDMVKKLAAKLKADPKNAEGWYMLARSYMSMGRYQEAVAALEKTNKLVPNNPVIMLRYADALTMLAGGKVTGQSFELVKKAIALKPDDPTGLWLAGMGYEQQGNYNKAISYWKLLLALVKDDKTSNEVKELIRRAQSKAGISVAKSPAPVATMGTEKKAATALTVKVSIDKNQLKHVSMDDTVFIFAKAISGPPMPLAVVRKQVKDLPLQVTLDDSMAMIPSMKLSSFNKVKVTARVSKSGQPLLQKGDLHSEEKHITLPHSRLINIKINTVAN